MTRRSRTILLPLALAACLVLCWWLIRSDQRSADAAETGSGSGPIATAADPEAVAPKPDAAPLIVPSPFSDPDREAPVEVLTHGRTLFVCDKDSGKPIPNALVQVFDAEAFPYNADSMYGPMEPVDYGELWTLLGGRHRRFRTDDSGCTRIPCAVANILVIALDAAHWGARYFEPREEMALELRVGIRQSVDIHVVHGDGTPAPGHAVLALPAKGAGVSLPPWYSDENGRVHVDNLQLLQHCLDRLDVEFCLPTMPDCAHVTIGALPPPHAALRLIVPDSAPMRIRITGIDALPVTTHAALRVRLRVQDEAQQLATGITIHVRDGVALTPPLPLGAKVLVRILSVREEVEDCEIVVDGPSRGDVTHEVAIPLPPVQPLFKVRLLDDAGHPKCATEVQIRSTGWRHVAAHFAGVTNADGVLRGLIHRRKDNYQPAPEEIAEGHRLTIFTTEDGSGSCLFAEFPLPAEFARGVNDLGTVTLHPAPLLVAGIVVDDSGRPLRNTVVSATAFDWHEVGTAIDDAPLVALSCADGSFSFRSMTRRKEVRVACTGEMLFPMPPREVPVGSTGVTLTSVRGGQLAGRVLLPPGIPGHTMRVRVISHSTASELLDCFGFRDSLEESEKASFTWNSVPRIAALDDEGRFRTELMPPGPATAYVEEQTAVCAPFATIQSIEVLPGGITRDPRLDPMDLSQRAVLALQVLNERGEPAPWPVVHCHDDPHNGGHLGDAHGNVAIMVRRLPQEVVVSAPRCRVCTVPVVSADQKVQLSSGIAGQVHVGPLPEGLVLPAELVKGIVWHATALDTRVRGSAMVYETRIAFPNPVLYFPHPGAWKFEVQIPAPADDPERYYQFPFLDDGLINVPDGDGPHELHLAVKKGFFDKYLPKK